MIRLHSQISITNEEILNSCSLDLVEACKHVFVGRHMYIQTFLNLNGSYQIAHPNDSTLIWQGSCHPETL